MQEYDAHLTKNEYIQQSSSVYTDRYLYHKPLTYTVHNDKK